MSRAKLQSSLIKDQMQLAIALSSSLEEAKKQEKSKLMEEFEASNIEDGTVPQNIIEIQKEFLDRLQGPKPGPSKRAKKPPRPVSTLLVRSSEERMRIITEKVALVLIKEDSCAASVKGTPNLKHRQDHWEEGPLWSMSWMLSSDKNLHYTDSLKTFISPSNVKIGERLRNTHQVGRRLTPVKYRPCANETIPNGDYSQCSPYREHEIPCYSQETNLMNPAFQTQLELQNDWQRMLNNSKFSDVTIIVKEGTKLCAHKLVLFARSPPIIDDLDTENTLHWLTVPYSQAVAFLEYLYCGKLSAVSALAENVKGVVYLAKKYNVTELLKFLLISVLNIEDSDIKHCYLPTSSPCKRVPHSGTVSPDLFADSMETVLSNKKQQNSLTATFESEICRESRSDEDDDLIGDFFGTYNPTVCSPIIKCDYKPDVETLKASSSSTFKEYSRQCDINKSKSSSQSIQRKTSKSSLQQTTSDYSPDECVLSYKSLFSLSPESKNKGGEMHLTKTSLPVGSSSHEELTKTISIKEQEYSDSTINLSPQFDANYLRLPLVSSKRSHNSLFPPSKRMCVDTEKSHNSNGCEENSCIFSTPLAQGKHSCSENIQKYNSFSKQGQVLTEGSLILQENSGTSILKSCGTHCKNERNLLDDSFNFDVNDSVLLKQVDNMQTPERNSLQLRQLRTPVDIVNTSSPVTPMPDYEAMTKEQFKMELLKYGVKRSLSRSNGIKMLKYLHENLHPMVEVLSHDGKDIFIPVGEMALDNK